MTTTGTTDDTTDGSTTRWGIASTGGMARTFVDDLVLLPDAEVAFVGSRDAARAAAFAEPHGAGSGTYADLLAADVDVLYVATPHPQHHARALAAIEAGVPVLVEKAFTATLAGAEEVVAAARSRGVFCMEAMWTRFVPAVALVRELVAAGDIGEPVLVQGDFGISLDYDSTGRHFDPTLGGGAVLDLGVYPLSLAQHLMGRPDRVEATATRFPTGVDANAVVQLAWADGRGASAACSLTGATPGRAVVVGTAGTIELLPPMHHPSRIVVRRGDAEPEEIERPLTGVGYVHQAQEVHRCLAAGLTESPVMTLDDTLDVMWVLEETLAQLGITMAEAPVDL